MITIGVAIAAAMSKNFKPELLFIGTLYADVLITMALIEAL